MARLLIKRTKINMKYLEDERVLFRDKFKTSTNFNPMNILLDNQNYNQITSNSETEPSLEIGFDLGDHDGYSSMIIHSLEELDKYNITVQAGKEESSMRTVRINHYYSKSKNEVIFSLNSIIFDRFLKIIISKKDISELGLINIRKINLVKKIVREDFLESFENKKFLPSAENGKDISINLRSLKNLKLKTYLEKGYLVSEKDVVVDFDSEEEKERYESYKLEANQNSNGALLLSNSRPFGNHKANTSYDKRTLTIIPSFPIPLSRVELAHLYSDLDNIDALYYRNSESQKLEKVDFTNFSASRDYHTINFNTIVASEIIVELSLGNSFPYINFYFMNYAGSKLEVLEDEDVTEEKSLFRYAIEGRDEKNYRIQTRMSELIHKKYIKASENVSGTNKYITSKKFEKGNILGVTSISTINKSSIKYIYKANEHYYYVSDGKLLKGSKVDSVGNDYILSNASSNLGELLNTSLELVYTDFEIIILLESLNFKKEGFEYAEVVSISTIPTTKIPNEKIVDYLRNRSSKDENIITLKSVNYGDIDHYNDCVISTVVLESYIDSIKRDNFKILTLKDIDESEVVIPKQVISTSKEILDVSKSYYDFYKNKKIDYEEELSIALEEVLLEEEGVE